MVLVCFRRQSNHLKRWSPSFPHKNMPKHVFSKAFIALVFQFQAVPRRWLTLSQYRMRKQVQKSRSQKIDDSTILKIGCILWMLEDNMCPVPKRSQVTMQQQTHWLTSWKRTICQFRRKSFGPHCAQCQSVIKMHVTLFFFLLFWLQMRWIPGYCGSALYREGRYLSQSFHSYVMMVVMMIVIVMVMVVLMVERWSKKDFKMLLCSASMLSFTQCQGWSFLGGFASSHETGRSFCWYGALQEKVAEARIVGDEFMRVQQITLVV